MRSFFFSALDNLWGAETFDLMILPSSESILGCTEVKLPLTSLQTDSADRTSLYCLYTGHDVALPRSVVVFPLIKMSSKQPLLCIGTLPIGLNGNGAGISLRKGHVARLKPIDCNDSEKC